jgi:class 3 adenylate cyclase
MHLLVREGGEPGAVVRWGPEGAPDASEVGPAPVFELSAGASGQRFVVEEPAWDGEALQPVHLFNLQEFRDLFTEQYLGAGVQLNVGEQTVLFTDIVGSTRLYAEVGDPTAFVAVKGHFAEIYQVVRAQGGAVVKTIGDAVMAAFSDPTAAVKAAGEIHRRFPAAPAGQNGAGHGLRLRVSINTGPCIAVNLNSGIDYFGGTVNAAAKLQRCANAGEVALADSVLRAPGVTACLAALGGEVRDEILDHDALGRLNVKVWYPIVLFERSG